MKYHDHTVYSILNNGKKVPLIRLSGHWLESCGFKSGCKYTVNELSGCLLLMVGEKSVKSEE
jgi:hypothetical protein